jgi:hypothetical protein
MVSGIDVNVIEMPLEMTVIADCSTIAFSVTNVKISRSLSCWVSQGARPNLQVLREVLQVLR